MSSGRLPSPFKALQLEATNAWGSRPGEARVKYLLSDTGIPVPVLAMVRIAWGTNTWWGVCLDDQEEKSDSNGTIRGLRVVDTRQYLEWDTVFAAFNIRENRLVEGRLQRRYRHLLPKNFVSGTYTFTEAPMTAAQVLKAVFGFTRASRSPEYTVETVWRLLTHRVMRTNAALDLDWRRGATLQQIAQEVADKLGLVVGLQPSDPWTLIFERKGFGSMPVYADGTVFPPASTDRRWGVSYSGAPTRIRVVGDRNQYQVMNIEMIPDWLPAWEKFLDITQLEDDLFHRATSVAGNPPREVPLNAIPGDDGGIEGRFRAAAMAREITVGQYATLRRRRRLPTDERQAVEWRDEGLWQGRIRSDMPAALYIAKILFRAFRPANLRFPITGTRRVPVESLEIVPRMLAPVAHDPVSGRMQVDPDAPSDGNGYVIAQGYQIGGDGLVSVQPEFFKLTTWKSLQDLWQAIPFSTDSSSEGVPTILFADPVIRTDNLIEMVDGIPVIRADAKIQAPRVRACLVFAAEVFQHVQGNGHRDRVELVADLAGEFIVSAAGDMKPMELPFADGEYSKAKARRIAAVLLDQQQFTIRGGFQIPGSPGYKIGSLIDRVTTHVSAGGIWEQVDFTNERLPNAFESERRFDRIRREQLLLPGQAELRNEARSLRQLAAAVRSGDSVRQSFDTWLRGTSEPPLVISEAPDGAKYQAGAPIWGYQFGPDIKLRPTYQPNYLANRFLGVVTRQDQPATTLVPVKSSGVIHARVKGPVRQNESVGRASSLEDMNKVLVARGDVQVGHAQADVPAGQTRLIPVRVSSGEAGFVKAMRKVRFVQDGDNGRIEYEVLEEFGPHFFVEPAYGPNGREEGVYEISITADSPLWNAVPRVSFLVTDQRTKETVEVHTVMSRRFESAPVAEVGTPGYRRWLAWAKDSFAERWQDLQLADSHSEAANEQMWWWMLVIDAIPIDPASGIVPPSPGYLDLVNLPFKVNETMVLRPEMVVVEFL
ncbi:MAG: hypothetical protein IT581_06475 [Verrucomicrobiales bacterium]|nr:hypothetical protein [Verrucomicrobiales bacterium]